ALDAASRGLSVALVDKSDLASGTSRWSSKLAHGGLRYIAKGQVGVAWESAVERNHLFRTIAPHLVRPMRFVIPELPGYPVGDKTIARAGFTVADGLRLAAWIPPALPPTRCGGDGRVDGRSRRWRAAAAEQGRPPGPACRGARARVICLQRPRARHSQSLRLRRPTSRRDGAGRVGRRRGRSRRGHPGGLRR